MTHMKIIAGSFSFGARLETDLAPKTSAYFRTLLPYRTKLIHVRWSGEGCWIPLGETALSFPVENATSYPMPGQFLFYPGGYSEAEILLAYGAVQFASKLGQLAGNHFLTVTDGLHQLPELGRRTLWEGAQEIVIDRV
ncbi:DUF3830 family protein [Nitrospirillum iridis]|uniref:Cyclophilin-like superfamily protein n=1 Tax=Nitrospirillum iridis TaxID=765888 RepID=A0A7X0AXV4_9PROT|nr:DUF3830 family protein [Nitrospirillum iridis]MBB6252138.1 hypothetical protein [Nitrospirillum iridis]